MARPPKPHEEQRKCRAVAYLSPAEMDEVRTLCGSNRSTVREIVLRGIKAIKQDAHQHQQLIEEISAMGQELGWGRFSLDATAAPLGAIK